MLENVQIITENEQAKFAVIPFAEFQEIQTLLSNPDKLADYLDYLHMQQVKAGSPARLSLAQVKAAC
jgi:hypothetical protein